MSNSQQCRQALTGLACPKKATELFYITAERLTPPKEVA